LALDAIGILRYGTGASVRVNVSDRSIDKPLAIGDTRVILPDFFGPICGITKPFGPYNARSGRSRSVMATQDGVTQRVRHGWVANARIAADLVGDFGRQ
jgi:hypothetical protein